MKEMFNNLSNKLIHLSENGAYSIKPIARALGTSASLT